MPYRTGHKAHRLLDFLVGLGDPRVRRMLERHGFSQAELDDGWGRLRALSEAPVAIRERTTVPSELDAWENRWFPIVDVVLRTRHPRVHEVVFRNLHQTEGAEVLVSVRTLLERLEAIGRPEKRGGLGKAGRDALDLLARRGLNEEALGHARALLARMQEGPGEDVPAADPEARARAEERLWNWYLEWSGIARAVIKERSVLVSLGFRGRGRRRKE